MKIARIAAAALLVSCATLPELQSSKPNTVSNQSAQNSSSSLANQNVIPREPLFDKVEGKISAQNGKSDTLKLNVIIRQPEFSTKRLELSRIRRLRASAAGPGIEEPIQNLNEYVATSSQAGQSTQLQIQEVPRGRQRIVTVQGYDEDGPNFPEVPGATLKAVYDSPEESTEVNLIFTWRSTAAANVIEALQTQAQTNPDVAGLLEELDTTALNTLLDKLIYGTDSPTNNTPYVIHPTLLDPTGIANAIVSNDGQIPSYTTGTPTPSTWLSPQPDVTLVVKTPQNTNFTNSIINVQITDPASGVRTISNGNSSTTLPDIIPGTWDAIVHINAPNGGVTSRAQVIVSDTGTVTLVEGTNQTPIILPPVIQSLSATQGGAGSQITITGDGFNPVANGNTVKFGNTTATVVSATPTSLVVTVPSGMTNGAYPVTVTSNGKTSNHIDFTVGPAVTAILNPSNPTVITGAPIGTWVRIEVSGYDPTLNPPSSVTFPGVNGPITVPVISSTPTTITVAVPSAEPGNSSNTVTNGPITITLPNNGGTIQSPNFTVNGPYINTVTNTVSNQPIQGGSVVRIEGGNFNNVTSVTLNGQPVTAFSVTNTGLIQATLPAGASSGPLVVNSSSGSATIPLNIISPPTITNVTPPVNTGDPMVITGTNFLNTTTVTVNGQTLVPGSYQVVNNTTINLLNPPTNPVQGPIQITTPGGTATHSLTYKDVINYFGAGNYARTDNDYRGFCSPHGIDVDKLGNIHLAGLGCVTNSGAVYKVAADKTVTVYGNANIATTVPVDGTASQARFNSPEDVTNDSNNNIYVADTGNHAIRRIDAVTGRVDTLARVPGPEGVQISKEGDLYITANHPPNGIATRSYLLKIPKEKINTIPDWSQLTPYNGTTAAQAETTMMNAGNVEIVAGGVSTCHPLPYTIPAATTVANTKFCHLEGLGMDGQGNVYIADVDNYHIRKMNIAAGAGGSSSVIAKVYSSTPTTTAPTIYMHEIRVDSAGNIFVPSNGTTPAPGIYHVNPQGNISLIAGNVSGYGFTEGNPLTQAKFYDSRGVDIGPDGTLYIVDIYFGIRKIERFHPVNNLQVP